MKYLVIPVVALGIGFSAGCCYMASQRRYDDAMIARCRRTCAFIDSMSQEVKARRAKIQAECPQLAVEWALIQAISRVKTSYEISAERRYN